MSEQNRAFFLYSDVIPLNTNNVEVNLDEIAHYILVTCPFTACLTKAVSV